MGAAILFRDGKFTARKGFVIPPEMWETHTNEEIYEHIMKYTKNTLSPVMLSWMRGVAERTAEKILFKKELTETLEAEGMKVTWKST